MLFRSQARPDTTLGDGDGELERGEAWVYTCTRAITQETVAMAVVSAQDTGTSTTARQQVRVDRANLRMKKKQVNDLRIGKETTYTLEVDNNGNIAAPRTVVNDPLDPGVTFVRATANNGSCSLAAGTVTCALGEIPAETNGAYVITLVVAAKPEGVGKTVENRATVSSAIGDFNPLDNASSAYGVIFAADQCTVASRDCSPPPPAQPTDSTVSDTEPLRSGSANPPTVPSQSPVNPRLATTGADSLELATWALLFVASGSALLALSRRRRLLGNLASFTA